MRRNFRFQPRHILKTLSHKPFDRTFAQNLVINSLKLKVVQNIKTQNNIKRFFKSLRRVFIVFWFNDFLVRLVPLDNHIPHCSNLRTKRVIHSPTSRDNVNNVLESHVTITKKESTMKGMEIIENNKASLCFTFAFVEAFESCTTFVSYH